MTRKECYLLIESMTREELLEALKYVKDVIDKLDNLDDSLKRF